MGKSKFYVEGSENFLLFPFTLQTLSINPVKRSFNEFLHCSSNPQFYIELSNLNFKSPSML